MSSALQAAGSQDGKYVPLFTNRWFLGLWTNRNPLRSPVGVIYENYYRLGGTDALIGGQNIEISNRLTGCRRPGNTAGLTGIISSANLPDVADAFYSFQELGGTVRVFADTPSSPYLLLSSALVPIFNKVGSPGQSYFQGVGQTLYISDPKEQQKWIDTPGLPGNSLAVITKVQLTSNVATITAQNGFAVGQTVRISGTATSSGAFNVNVVVTAITRDPTGLYNDNFSFSLTHADIGSTSDSGYASGTWNFGISAPTVQPTVTVVESGSAATIWQANTWFSTMGVMVDANGNAEQLLNTTTGTQFGTSSNGQPAWNQTTGGTTTDNTVTWTNLGPIVPWTPFTTYANQSAPGVGGTSCTVYDYVTGCVFTNFRPGGSSGTSGGTRPNFPTTVGASVRNDGTCDWYCRGNANIQPNGLGLWQPGTVVGTGNFIVEPSALPLAAGEALPSSSTQTLYLQHVSTAGTTSSSNVSPKWPILGAIGVTTLDNQLNWISLGSATWAASTTYYAWSGTASTFSVVKDSNGSLWVCIVGGISAASTPFVAPLVWQANHAYTLGQTTIDTNSNTEQITTPGTSGGSAPSWATAKGSTTSDNSATWTNQGSAYGTVVTESTGVQWVNIGRDSGWIANIQYYRPTQGWNPPGPSDPFGGADVNDGTNIEFVVQTGESGNSTPSWNGTVTGQTVDSTVVWYNNGPFVLNSLSWDSGYSWAYAYKSRSMYDQFAPAAIGTVGALSTAAGGLGGGEIPPLPLNGLALGFPTGSADGTVSTASPVTTVTNANAGAVVTLSGPGSTDPQVDTVEIYRTKDGGATLFLLTDIPNPTITNGVAGTWTVQDVMGDNPTATLPGLDTLVIAGIGGFNNPPPVAMINITQHLGRIFGSVGGTVYASDGPLVGGASQPPGNGFTQFNPGQFWSFPSIVTRLVPTTSGLLVFTTSDLYVIAGGPNITQVFQNILIPGLGLTSYNALGVQGGIIYLLTADNQQVAMDANMGVTEIGFPIGDQIDTFSPASSYVTFHIQGSNDKALFVADGSTGWFRCNPNQAPDAAISGPVWSPKANIVGGCGAIASLEVSPGKHALLIGATTSNNPILVRDSNYLVFKDNNSTYEANMTFGSMVLVNPGQLAELSFVTCEYIKTGTSPRLLVLLDEIQDTVLSISAASQSGSNTTYTYTLVSGPAVFQGMYLTISGMANSGNNGTFQITGTGAGTFTVVNASGSTHSGQTGTGTRFEDLSGYTFGATSLPPQDPPLIFGATTSPSSVFSNRYYFAQSINGVAPPFGTSCRHMQVQIDFGSIDSVQNEILTLSIYGAHWEEAGG